MDMREVFTIDGRRFSNMAGFYDEVEPVSYTHLDVYKRQVYTSGVVFEPRFYEGLADMLLSLIHI